MRNLTDSFTSKIFNTVTHNYCGEHYGYFSKNLDSCPLCEKAEKRKSRLVAKFKNMSIEQLTSLAETKKSEVKTHNGFLNYLDIKLVISIRRKNEVNLNA